MAGLWKLPIVYTIENNRYGMGTSVERASHVTTLMAKFRGYPGLKIDAQNIFMVREATKFCKNYAIENGPIFFELETYRYQGHSMSDPGLTYRSRDEIETFKHSRDCIDKVRAILLEHDLVTEIELKEIAKKIREDIERDIAKIKTDPYPDINELFKNVYIYNKPYFIRGIELESSTSNPNLQVH